MLILRNGNAPCRFLKYIFLISLNVLCKFYEIANVVSLILILLLLGTMSYVRFLRNGHVALLNLKVMSPYNGLMAQLAGDGLYVVAMLTGVSKVRGIGQTPLLLLPLCAASSLHNFHDSLFF